MKKIVAAILLVFLGFAQNTQAQILDRLIKKAEEKVFRETEKKVDQSIDKTETEKSKNENTSEKAVKNNQDKVAMQTYSKYDFIAGEKVVFFDDFTETAVGDFPPNWNTTASGEIVTNNVFTGNWFKMIGEGCVALDEGIKLPDNYTIEFDVIPYTVNEDNVSFEYGFYLYSAQNPKDLNEGGAVPGYNGGIKMSFGYRATYSAYNEEGYTISGEKEDAKMEAGKKYRLSFWVQKTRLRVYQDQVKIFDLPKVFKPGMICNQMRFELWGESAPMITNFRIAAGLPDMRSKLITEGKLVSYGIYFDVNKDVVKPESYGTLKAIADVLKENPTVRIKIVGHTDADGADKSNLDLSKRRGESVKTELTKIFAIDASRLEFDGMGESKPIAPNDTQANKALNRRVEFIKL
ncbi:OmpA family protein [Flavobacterium sp.]|uniref:OmpA family protein n=1 Tax=Flavobacterium sp. TaxID=239 RepID=UPI0037BF429F